MMIRNKKICMAALVVLLVGLGAGGQEIITPNDDVTLRGSTNYNASDPFGLFVKNSSDVSYLEFDFGSVGATSAILTLHNDDTGVANLWEIVVRGEAFDFDEVTFTGTDVSGWTRVGTIPDVMAVDFYTLDLTDYYNANLGKRISFHLGRDSQPGGSGPIFEDREGTKTGDAATFGPRLEVIFANQARNPDPPHEATNVLPSAILTWDPPEADAVLDPCHLGYDVWFGTDPNAQSPTYDFVKVSTNQPETFFDPLGLVDLTLNTTYFWRIDVIDPNFGLSSPFVYTGKLWSFTTIPPKATEPDPCDGAVDVPQNAILSWTPGFGADEHDVYLDPCEYWVVNGDPRAYVGRQPESFIDPDLEWETVYFWRIDEVFTGGGAPEPGDVWRFTTGVPICDELEGDANKDCIVDIRDLALVGGNWLICTVTNGDCP